jgi:tetratricopeptide (TPR) repeat protein
MRHLILLVIVATACSTSGQNKPGIEPAALSEQEILKKYLENGAWRVHYFSRQYQLYIDSAIALNPNIPYLYQQKAMPYFKQRKYERGMKILDKAVALDPKAYIDYRAFIKAVFAKTYEAAIADFEECKKIKGEHGFVMDHSYNFYIGMSYLQLNEFQRALSFLKKSIDNQVRANGEKWVHHLDLLYAGVASQEMDQHEEAIRYFDKALNAYPTFSDAKYYKFLSLRSLGQMESATKLLNECEADFKKGYTINEDNAIYETYPYQIKQFYIDAFRATKR